jgi:hypothetical protein
MYLVYYTGFRSNADGIHTFRRFLDIGREVGFYREGSTEFESVLLSAIESGAILYKVESTPYGGLKLKRYLN